MELCARSSIVARATRVAILGFAVHCAEAEELGSLRANDRDARAEGGSATMGPGVTTTTSSASTGAGGTRGGVTSGGSATGGGASGGSKDDAGGSAAGTVKIDAGPTCAKDCVLKVQYQNTTTPPEPMTATVRIRVDVLNTGTKSVALTDVTVRYWFSDAGGSGDQANCYFAQDGCPSLATKFVPVAPLRPHADRYLEIGFTDGRTLDSGSHTGTISVGVQHASGGPLYDQTDDYSYAPSQPSFVDWPNITAYVGGALVWGTEP
jgi:hypothetical protein